VIGSGLRFKTLGLGVSFRVTVRI